MICPRFLNPVHETSWVNYKFCYKTVTNSFSDLVLLNEPWPQDAPNPEFLSSGVSLDLVQVGAVTVWPPARYLWAHENCQCETDGNNILRTQEALTVLSRSHSRSFYRLGSEVPGHKGLVHSVTAYDDKEVSSPSYSPMVPPPWHSQRKERKLMAILVMLPECDQNSGSPLFAYVHWAQTKARKESKMKHSSSIWQCLKWEDALPQEAPSAALGQVPDAHQNAESCFFQAHHEEHHLSTWVTARAHDFPAPSALTLGTPDSAWVPILSSRQLEDLHPRAAPACLSG